METKRNIEKYIEKQPQYRKIQGLIGESSFSIVLPKSYALDLGISKGEFVKVYCIENRIIIEKAL
jgi:hypothetical protein